MAKAHKVNIHKSVSRVNEALAKLFDSNGIKRRFSVPYIDGQGHAEHVAALHKVLEKSGGIGNSFITTYHKQEGGGWGSADGETVGHDSTHLHLPVKSEDADAMAVIGAVRTLLNQASHLLGDKNAVVVQSRSQLKLISAHNGAGMELGQFGSAMVELTAQVVQAIARAHSGKKQENGIAEHSPALRPPRHGMQEPSDDDDAEDFSGEETSEDGSQTPNVPSAAPASPAPIAQ